MSLRAMAYIKEMVVTPSGERITRSEKLVGLVLADAHQDKRGAHTYPSVRSMAEDALMDERQCRRVLGALDRKGVITIDRPHSQGRGHVTFYRFPELDDVAESEKKGGHFVPLLGGEFFLQKEGKRGTKGGQKGDISAHALDKQERKREQKTTPLNPLASEGKEASDDAEDFESVLPPSSASVAADGGRESAVEANSAKHSANPDGGQPASGKPEPRPEVRREAGDERADDGAALRRAVAAVASALSVTCKRTLRRIEAQIALAMEKGEPAPVLALSIINAWREYCDAREYLRWFCGLDKFVKSGMWRDKRSWPWDDAALRKRAEMGVGSYDEE